MHTMAGWLVFITALEASTPTANEILAQVRTAQSWHDQVRMKVHCLGTDDAQRRTDEFNCQYANRGTDTMYVGSRVMRDASGEIWESVDPIYDIKTREFKVSAQRQSRGLPLKAPSIVSHTPLIGGERRLARPPGAI